MIDILGYAASAAVLATFLMPSMVSLRLVAIASNILFMLYGYLAHIPPVLVLHVALLPINVARLAALTGNRRWSWIDRRRGAACVETASAVARRRQRLGV